MPPSPVQRLGEISREYELKANLYEGIALDAAQAEADYRKLKAQTMLRAMADGASAVKAEAIANADDVVAAACLQYKSSAALADAAKSKLTQLREQVATGRSVMVGEREADRIHAQGATP